MRVAIIYQYYQGHDAPGHSLVYELSQHLANRGHTVSVIAGDTGYMKRDAPSLPWYRRIVRKQRENGVTIVRTYTYPELHRSYFGRLLSFLSFTVSCPLGLFFIKKPDVVLASSPPLFPAFSAWLHCKLRGIRFVTEVRDLWPDSAVELGIVRNKVLIGIMRFMEETLYAQSAKIIALTDGIKRNICERGWSADKVEVITCGVDQQSLYPDSEGGAAVRRRYGWDDKYVIMYFGALGEANNLPVIMRAAERLRALQEVVFVLIGDGMYRKTVVEEKERRKLENLLVLTPVPKHDARVFINAANACVVTLRDIPLFRGAIPTKLVDYMACGKPVLCGVRGEAERVLNEARAGLIFDPDDDEALASLVLDLRATPDRANAMGAAGKAYVDEHFLAETMRSRAETLLLTVSSTGKKAHGRQ